MILDNQSCKKFSSMISTKGNVDNLWNLHGTLFCIFCALIKHRFYKYTSDFSLKYLKKFLKNFGSYVDLWHERLWRCAFQKLFIFLTYPCFISNKIWASFVLTFQKFLIEENSFSSNTNVDWRLFRTTLDYIIKGKSCLGTSIPIPWKQEQQTAKAFCIIWICWL